MVKRALTLLTSILFALPLLMPFNIYADELPQTEIIGTDFNLISYSSNTTSNGIFYSYTYEIEIKLRNNYVGVIDGTLSYSWSNQDSSTGNPTSHTATYKRKSYVNGNSFKVNIVLQGSYSTFTGKGPLFSVSYLVDNSDTNVVKYEDLDSIETVVNLLQDIYQNSSDIENLSTNQLTELEKIVTNTNLSNEYLDKINKLRQWNIDMESMPFVISCLKYLDLVDYPEFNYYNYPVFKLKQNDIITQILTRNRNNDNEDTYGKYYIVMWVSQGWALANMKANFQFDNGGEIIDLGRIQTQKVGSQTWQLVRLTVANFPTAQQTSIFRYVGTAETYIVPIYVNVVGVTSLSTDFSLRYALPYNSQMQWIHDIANGTVQSNSAASSNDLANEQLQTDSNTLFEQENGFKSDMQSAMQNVNNTFRLQDMGTKFVTSAQWVRTQYEQLTNNTPFASLITFSLITGLALILLGKVYR